MFNPFIFLSFTIVLTAGYSVALSTDPSGPIVAADNQFPYMVSIRRTEFELIWNKGIHLCAGALLTKRLVLTAAHCIFDMFGNYIGSRESLTVIAGSPFLDVNSTVSVQRAVAKVYVHPAYTADTREADLALMMLDRDIVFSDSMNISAVEVSKYPAVVGDTCIVLGWNNYSATTISPDVLQYYKVELHPKDLCRASYQCQTNYLSAQQLCTCPTAFGVNNNICYNGNLCQGRINASKPNNDCPLHPQPPPPPPQFPPPHPPQKQPPPPIPSEGAGLDLTLTDCLPPDNRPDAGDPGGILVCNNKITGVLAYSYRCQDFKNHPQIFTEIIEYIGFMEDPDNFLPEMWQYLIHDDSSVLGAAATLNRFVDWWIISSLILISRIIFY